MFKVGAKVIGDWGPLHSPSYGKISEINIDNFDSPLPTMSCIIDWAEGGQSQQKLVSIHWDNVGSAGIGIYFAGGDEPDEWFEKEGELI